MRNLQPSARRLRGLRQGILGRPANYCVWLDSGGLHGTQRQLNILLPALGGGERREEPRVDKPGSTLRGTLRPKGHGRKRHRFYTGLRPGNLRSGVEGAQSFRLDLAGKCPQGLPVSGLLR